MKNNKLFWISYSDIMTALFFIMLILFVVSAVFFQNQLKRVEVLEEEREQIEAIQESLASLDEDYFNFDEENKRYRLNIDVRFNSGGANINVVGDEVLNRLEQAGKSLYSSIESIIENNDKAHLLLVIEGNAQRSNNNYKYIPDAGYKLSYRRALALFNFWKDRGIDFYSFGERCEVIIAGSGYFGLSRAEDSSKNRRFTLQVTSKWTLSNSL
jgi:outer membrane protein OmpA-like peptidoglycan-associated protein